MGRWYEKLVLLSQLQLLNAPGVCSFSVNQAFFVAYQVVFCCIMMQCSTLCHIKSVCTENSREILLSTPFLHSRIQLLY